jgi:hypothetical protein
VLKILILDILLVSLQYKFNIDLRGLVDRIVIGVPKNTLGQVHGGTVIFCFCAFHTDKVMGLSS